MAQHVENQLSNRSLLVLVKEECVLGVVDVMEPWVGA
jgi:hypothetical protein